MFRTILDRLRFKLRLDIDYPFVYDATTGRGCKPLAYSFFKDQVRFRMSQFGTYAMGGERGQLLPRDEFVRFYSNPNFKP